MFTSARYPTEDQTHDPVLVRVGSSFAQQTFPEAKTAAMAFADGPSLRRWSEVEGEVALCHVVANWPLQTKVVGGPLLEWLHMPADSESLRHELQASGIPAVLAWHVCIGLALDHVQVDVALDELIAAIGWHPRSSSERECMRSRWWRWMALFDSAQVIGRRPGKYRDYRTRDMLDLTSIDALIRITGRRLPLQPTLDESGPPIEVSFVAGPWLDQHRHNKQVLAYFGDIRRLAAIPAGKPSGAWAQAIGVALQQLWRERSARVPMIRVGEDKHATPRFEPVTRELLLDLFPPSPTVYDVLSGPHPKRAQVYWNEAIRQLKRAGMVGYYRPGLLTLSRQGWQKPWLSQPLDIRPSRDGVEAIGQIRKQAMLARRGGSGRGNPRPFGAL